MKTYLDILFVALLGSCLCVGGCSRAQAAQDDHSDHDHAGHTHADGTATTQAEWCSLNGVPEAKCSSVLAEYKAKGDWCEVHNLPKSKCIKCNPSLKLQPSKAN